MAFKAENDKSNLVDYHSKPAEHLLGLPSPSRISIWWNIGSILAVLLGVQIVTGFFLSIHYTADIINTFTSVIHIIRDAPGGWAIRNFHANGATLFFVFLYLHIGRGLYYQRYISQPKSWIIGITIIFLSIATAFLGYVLPWGQMSFWGATVITNLVSAIPYLGPSIVEWLWGGFSVGQRTLNRFFSLHFIIPFVIGALAALHILFLHEKGSTNPLGETTHIRKIPFHPYFSWKDIVGFLFLFILLVTLGIAPNLLNDPENYIPANPIITPVHIQPEWYFLFAYAILRSIPRKLGGVIALVISIAVMYFLPFVKDKEISSAFILPYQVCFWFFVVSFMILTWLGACPIEEPYTYIAGPISVFYFVRLGALAIPYWKFLF